MGFGLSTGRRKSGILFLLLLWFAAFLPEQDKFCRNSCGGKQNKEDPERIIL